MPLLDLWEKARETVISMSAMQILANAGNGSLRDNSKASYELREFLTYISIDEIEKYTSECLNGKIADSGFLLQDIVNELGRRLENDIEHGLYRGVKGKVGFDGLWKSPEGHFILVEVKSSTAYSIYLDRIAAYRESLKETGEIGKNSSILIAVGSEDTSGLEAQIRGSRYAWDMRVISVDSLIKLVRIKEATDEEDTAKKIRSLLVPIEYTKLDGIIDIMFATTADIEETMTTQDITVDVAVAEGLGEEDSACKISRTGKDQIEIAKQGLLAFIEKHISASLQAKSRALYLTKDGKTKIFCAISKKYSTSYTEYWYAYRMSHRAFLKDAETAYIALGCADSSKIFLVPFHIIEEALPHLNCTESKTGNKYWHIFVTNENGYVLVTQKGCENIPLADYLFSLK